MAIKPILFSAPMVRAILDGRKTQTRRVVPKKLMARADLPRGDQDVDAGYPFVEDGYGDFHALRDLARYQPGDILWVREPAKVVDVKDYGEDGMDLIVQYLADGKFFGVEVPSRMSEAWELKYQDRWPVPEWVSQGQGIPNGVFREAARIFLEVTMVRAQRIQDISEEDAQYEGVARIELGPWEIEGIPVHPMTSTYKEAFHILWDSINAKRGFGWDANPWVWAYTFKRVEKPEGWPE